MSNMPSKKPVQRHLLKKRKRKAKGAEDSEARKRKKQWSEATGPPADLNNRETITVTPGPSRSHEGNEESSDEEEREGEPDSEEVAIDEIFAKLSPEFLEVVSEEVVKDCTRAFIARTGNEALTTSPCGVCARLTPNATIITFDTVTDIPNSHLLKPHRLHPHHNIIAGLIFHETVQNGSPVDVCTECLRRLKLDKLPPLALANNMWIGAIPFQLRVLTLAERILVAIYYPAAYIVKLYPKDPSVRYWDPNSLNSGLKGNVSTYPLDPKELATYIFDGTMPPPANILSATIGVTLIGPRGFPERTMPDLLKVRRQRVRDALAWLKANNPLYSNIVMSEERLQQLPEDGIPTEIMATARFSTDLDSVMREHETYVPQDNDDILPIPEGTHAIGDVIAADDPQDNEGEQTEAGEPAVIPIHALGTIDVTGCTIPDAELMAHALANTAEGHSGRDLQIRRGSAFVNEYARTDPITGERTDGGPSNPNHLLGSFPWLFPYGCGGFEVKREIDVPYETHAKWALTYADKRFRLDMRFIFQVFGVIQKRAVCRAACLHISKPSFTRHQNAIATLEEKDFLQASQEEMARRPISNPVMRVLREELSTVRVSISGSDESRVGIRRKIWGATTMFGPPAIWLTVNPSDTHDPIVQFLAGKDIDLDNFDRLAGPSSTERATNVAKDPYAAAQFFHHVIISMLEEVFGIVGAKGVAHVRRKKGLLGVIQGYVGTVEAQGRGTLHLHAILWLKGGPSASDISKLLKKTEYRDRVRNFIRAHISADIDGLDGASVQQLPRQSDLAYSRPLDPDSPNYEIDCKERERLLARSVQYHQCSTATCLQIKNGKMQCKRRAPFELSSREWVTSIGHWGPKRYCPYLNNFNRCLMQLFRSNHDIKLITNGTETRDIGWYITNYAAKKQKRSNNVSALLARRFAFHQKQEKDNHDLHQIHKRLIQRCANTLSREQEFSAPEVISYLMGWGDRYISHNYVKIYWDQAYSALLKAYPQLDARRNRSSDESTGRIQCVNGSFKLNDQLQEYVNRGDDLESESLFYFLLDTYEGAEAKETVDRSGRGRRPNMRVPYKNGFRAGRCRVLRSEGHESLPEFIGKWIPKECEEQLGGTDRQLRNIQRTFHDFCANAPSNVLRAIDNLQYYHSSKDGRRRDDAAEGDGPVLRPSDTTEMVEHTPDSQSSTQVTDFQEEDVELARKNAVDGGQVLFAKAALAIAEDIGVFRTEQRADDEWTENARRASGDDELAVYAAWSKGLIQTTRERPHSDTLPSAVPRTSISLTTTTPQVLVTVENATPTKSTREELAILNEEQRRAHDIVEEHLLQFLAKKSPEQLLMTCFGEGGTGKTTLINAITATFSEHGAQNLLAKTATSGVAATMIGGETLHSWLGVGIGMPKKENWLETAKKGIKLKRKRNIADKLLLIIDECSMMTSEMLGLVTEVVTATRLKEGKCRPLDAFGGMSIIMFGDFHQFPPVSRANLALYKPTTVNKRAMIGQELYTRFQKVVLLCKQNRVKDARWTEFLRRLRHGACNAEDMEMVETLRLTNPDCDIPDFSKEPWSEAVLVTSRVEVKNRWNQAALTRHSQRTGNRIFVSSAHDMIENTGGTTSEPSMFHRVLLAGSTIQDTQRMAERVELAVGMKAMVIVNIATEADLANGTRGTVEEIILDPREPPTPDTKPQITFEGLEDGLIPIIPGEVRFSIEEDEGKKIRVRRRQLALTQAYAFTDYKSQGQTIPCVIVDLQQPPDRGSKLTPFSVYVALSRSRGRDTIRILRSYDEKLFTQHPCPELAVEDERLERLNKETREWYLSKQENEARRRNTAFTQRAPD
ncbi:hypothetical protein NP233_g5549 [Leucocoprinus birnbaumii]|uniref:ATP-dependent DNA helicase n=1 Tax=Leucocoprinus birnbaumii TaxID=56174 RepID=A0AAD5YQU8_9AGAR|nr:hypothetical protein NP233_g5549 [Leucocoprinus birnbaumii]